MRRTNPWILVLTVLVSQVGCQQPASGSAPLDGFGLVPALPDPSSGQDGSADAANEADSAPPAEAGSPEAEAAVTGDDTLGSLEVQPIADTPCTLRAGAGVELYPQNGDAPFFDSTARVGGRRAAGGSVTQGFVLFDADGSSPMPKPVALSANYNLFGSEGQTVAVAATSIAGEILFQRYSDSGQELGQALSLGFDDVASLAIGSGARGSLVVWGAKGILHARGIPKDGTPGPVFSLGEASFLDFLWITVVAQPDGFAVAWTGNAADGTYATRLVRTGLSALAAAPSVVASSARQHHVTKIVATESGYALLLSGGAPGSTPYLVRLDPSGRALPPARRLEGAIRGWDLTAKGSEVAVVAARATLEPELRMLDQTLAPVTPWLCLDGPTDGGNVAAVDADGDGYAVVYRNSAGAEVFLHTNAAWLAGSP